jgi:hypothetical protein
MIASCVSTEYPNDGGAVADTIVINNATLKMYFITLIFIAFILITSLLSNVSMLGSPSVARIESGRNNTHWSPPPANEQGQYRSNQITARLRLRIRKRISGDNLKALRGTR